MQSKARLYANVLAASLAEAKNGKEIQERMGRLKELLKKRGDLKIAGRVAQEFFKAWQNAKGTQAILVSARRSANGAKEKIGALLEKKGFLVQEEIKPEVIGGLAILLGNELLIDGTIKAKLTKIWSSLQ
ncbi:MAG: F0F1 ATP synthase subunit delta [Candidatus Wildermuthbacteria bacterium]|nr:F0F1 ATP synthase subunit delta [Candidatus Wildermuthbacteria bacterium]